MEKSGKKRKKYRLRKPYRRTLFGMIGALLGVFFAFRVNAAAPETNITVDPSKISVEDYEFFKESKIIKVTLPTSLQQIGFSSFEGCSSLSNINLPDDLSVIDNRAFAKCTSLKEIVIPDSTVFIGNAAFYGCDELNNVILPSKLSGVSNNMFYSCDKLSQITIPNGVTSIGQQSFYDCVSLEVVELPESLTSISDGAFYDCKNLVTLNIPDSVTSIGRDAFTGCNQLTIVASEGSFGEKYAKDNGIRVTSDLSGVAETAMDTTKPDENLNKENPATSVQDKNKVIEPDVPATGVDTPYELMLCILIISLLGLFVINVSSRKEMADTVFSQI